MKNKNMCLVLALFICLPVMVNAGQIAQVTVATNVQYSRDLNNHLLYMFGGRTTSLEFMFNPVDVTLYGLRISLLQRASNLAMPVDTVYERVGKNGQMLILPEVLDVPLSLPDTKRIAYFDMVVSFLDKNGEWRGVDRVPLMVYPANFFSGIALYKKIVYAIFDRSGELQSLFETNLIPFIDFDINPEGIYSINDQEILLAICNLTETEDTAFDYVEELKQNADHVIVFKKSEEDLDFLVIHESEDSMKIQVPDKLLFSLKMNPRNQEQLFYLIQKVYEFSIDDNS